MVQDTGSLIKISIHALREESDAAGMNHSGAPLAISIHALREESDRKLLQTSSVLHYFNPRPPRGERPIAATSATMPSTFQSTPSARRATAGPLPGIVLPLKISIHALREESDNKAV